MGTFLLVIAALLALVSLSGGIGERPDYTLAEVVEVAVSTVLFGTSALSVVFALTELWRLLW